MYKIFSVLLCKTKSSSNEQNFYMRAVLIKTSIRPSRMLNFVVSRNTWRNDQIWRNLLLIWVNIKIVGGLRVSSPCIAGGWERRFRVAET